MTTMKDIDLLTQERDALQRVCAALAVLSMVRMEQRDLAVAGSVVDRSELMAVEARWDAVCEKVEDICAGKDLVCKGNTLEQLERISRRMEWYEEQAMELTGKKNEANQPPDLLEVDDGPLL
jgi:hypothetical protein